MRMNDAKLQINPEINARCPDFYTFFYKDAKASPLLF